MVPLSRRCKHQEQYRRLDCHGPCAITEGIGVTFSNGTGAAAVSSIVVWENVSFSVQVIKEMDGMTFMGKNNLTRIDSRTEERYQVNSQAIVLSFLNSNT